VNVLALIALLASAPILAQETVPDGEAAIASAIADRIAAQVRADAKTDGTARRDAHAKAHGCVHAVFAVADELPESFQRGVFQKGRRYASWLRFSNGSGRIQNDAVGDGRGMAIKLTGVPGPKLSPDEKGTQDFLLIDHPVFFVRNAADYPAAQAALGPHGSIFGFLFPSWNPLRWRFHEARIGRAIQARKMSDPLNGRYWSMTPYLMGDGQVVKFSARPCTTSTDAAAETKSPDRLREAMEERLRSHGACFDFFAQPRGDLVAMPVEDPTVEWSEDASPPVRVARITIPDQRFEGAAQTRFCENLSMNPWHSVPEHRPLGGINRVRRVVYAAISTLRHALNASPAKEPDGTETFPE
jgi:hypothetical protein